MNMQKPIGVFDSGLGGLSICHSIKSILPAENIIYFADLEYSPYGTKSKKEIKERSEFIVQFLINKGCKLVVVACNTATVNTINALRMKFAIPIVGIEPGIKPAALKSKNGVIGVLATQQTLNSNSFQQLKAKYSDTVRIEVKACPEFVNLVENLKHEGDAAVEAAEYYIKPLLAVGCDQIILGCSHFSFLRSAISKTIGTKADIVDTAIPVAMEVKRKLHHLNILSENNGSGSTKLWTSGCSIKTASSVNKLWGGEASVSQV